MALLRLIPLLLIVLCAGCGTTAALPTHETVTIGGGLGSNPPKRGKRS